MSPLVVILQFVQPGSLPMLMEPNVRNVPRRCTSLIQVTEFVHLVLLNVTQLQLDPPAQQTVVSSVLYNSKISD